MTIRGDRQAKGPRSGDAIWLNDLGRARRSGPAPHPRISASGNSTLAVHAGSFEDASSGAVGTPIYQNTTFLLNKDQYTAFEEGFTRDRFIYTRYGNPSQWAVQEKLAALEGAESAQVFSSGMAAVSSTLFALAEEGGHVVASRQLYGGTYNFLNQDFPNMGRSVAFVDPRDLSAIEAAIKPETQLLFFEAITNPTLTVADIRSIAALADKAQLRLVVDATFMPPVLCRTLPLGVDVVVHSATKYLNGHSDVTAGFAAGSRKLIDFIWSKMLNFGGCLDPHSCFLLERGLKTLAIRMKAHADGAMALAVFLESHPAVACVHYPFLPSHADYAIAADMMSIGPGIVAFELKAGDLAALKLLDVLKIPKQATSLGGVESLISLPFNTSHSSYTARQRRAMGINPGCVRVSVGIEDAQDLIDDFEAALKTIS